MYGTSFLDSCKSRRPTTTNFGQFLLISRQIKLQAFAEPLRLKIATNMGSSQKIW